MKALWQAIVLLALGALAGVAAYRWHPTAPALYLDDEPLGRDEVKLSTVLGEWNRDVIWIDARSEEAFRKDHVPGAIRITADDFTNLLWEHIDTLQTAESPIVIYCDGHACEASRKVADLLRENAGLPSVFILRGGWKTVSSPENRWW